MPGTGDPPRPTPAGCSPASPPQPRGTGRSEALHPRAPPSAEGRAGREAPLLQLPVSSCATSSTGRRDGPCREKEPPGWSPRFLHSRGLAPMPGGQATPEQGEEKDAPKQDMELSVIYSRANSKGFFYFFFFSKSYIINKRVCTFAMIHWRVKRRRYKYRYGCNVKKPPPNKTKKQKPNLGAWDHACAHSADGHLVAGIFRHFSSSKRHRQQSPAGSTKSWLAVLCRVLCLINKGRRERERWDKTPLH